MNFRVIKTEQQLESNWSGGKTLELAIFPEDAKYLDRDFVWRLSTANSDREESSFTKLPDYDRILMVLEGDVVLAHGDQRSEHLQAMEQDRFDGAVKTRCFGRLIRDYNLIYAKGCQAQMQWKKLRSNASPIDMSAEALEAMVSYGVFCLEGYTVISCGENSEMIRPGEQAVIDFPEGVEGDMSVMGEGSCIVTEIVMGRRKEDAGAEKGADERAEASAAGGASEAGAGTGEGAADPGFGDSSSGEAAGSKDSSAFADYLTSLKLYFGRTRWAMIMRREGMAKTYFDRAMSEKLKKLERWFIVEAVWLIGVMLCLMPLFRGAAPTPSLIAALLFTVIHIFGIIPGIYMTWLPRPFSRHMKSVTELNAAERAYLQEEISDDPHLEKLMKKYKSDDEDYFADDTSPLYHFMKRKQK